MSEAEIRALQKQLEAMKKRNKIGGNLYKKSMVAKRSC